MEAIGYIQLDEFYRRYEQENLIAVFFIA